MASVRLLLPLPIGTDHSQKALGEIDLSLLREGLEPEQFEALEIHSIAPWIEWVTKADSTEEGSSHPVPGGAPGALQLNFIQTRSGLSCWLASGATFDSS